MRILLAAMFVGLVGAPALAAAQDDRAETCAVEGVRSPDDAIVACGFVIHAEGSTAATRLRALLVRAEIQRRLSHPDLAMQDCDEAIRVDPGSAQAFELRGRVRRRHGKHLADDPLGTARALAVLSPGDMKRAHHHARRIGA